MDWERFCFKIRRSKIPEMNKTVGIIITAPEKLMALGEYSSQSERVEPSIVYEQWHNELRYYRLYEQAVAFWASTALLAFCGWAVAYLAVGNRPSIGLFPRLMLALAPLLFALTAAFIVRYVGRRYRQLRAQWESMEPSWKRALDAKTMKPLPRVFNPTGVQMGLILFLGLVAALAIWTVTNEQQGKTQSAQPASTSDTTSKPSTVEKSIKID